MIGHSFTGTDFQTNKINNTVYLSVWVTADIGSHFVSTAERGGRWRRRRIGKGRVHGLLQFSIWILSNSWQVLVGGAPHVCSQLQKLAVEARDRSIGQRVNCKY